jgi:hypothetical protein
MEAGGDRFLALLVPLSFAFWPDMARSAQE